MTKSLAQCLLLTSLLLVSCSAGNSGDPAGPGGGTVTVTGTGRLGPNALEVEIEGNATFEIDAGQWFQPYDSKYQRLMVTSAKRFSKAGKHLVDAACMEHSKSAPLPGTQFYPTPNSPSTALQQCQVACGADQDCIWGCEETAPSTMTWVINDGCSDGRGLYWQLFDKANGQKWAGPPIPSGGSQSLRIDCRTGAKICYGARTNPDSGTHWGVDLDGNAGCSSCCFTCAETTIARNLTCSD